MSKRGRKPLAEEKTVRVGYTVLESHEKVLARLSEEDGVPMSALVRRIFDEYFGRKAIAAQASVLEPEIR